VANLTDNRVETEPNSAHTGRSGAGWKQSSRWCILVLLLLGLVTSLSIVAYKYVRERIHNMECGNHLKAIGLALHTYHTQYGVFPPAHFCDEAREPINSWRTVIVPGRLWYTFPSTYDFTKRWDTPENSRLLAAESEKSQRHFQCPSADSESPTITNYVAVVGANTMWPGREPAKQAADGSDRDKILVIEVINSDILWMEPRDLTLEQALDAIQPKKGIIGIGSHHRDGVHYVTVGGEVRTLDPSIDREALRKLLVREVPKKSLPIATEKSAEPSSPQFSGDRKDLPK